MSSGAAPAVPLARRLVDEPLVLAYFIAALTYLAVTLLAGLLMALQLVQANPLAGLEIFSPGRWRMVHTNGAAYGFIANAFLGALHWAVPRLMLRPVLSRPLSWFIFVAWQGVVIATVIGLLAGQAQAVEWGETPTWIDPLALAGLALVAINFIPPIVSKAGALYVSAWYFLAAFVWTFLTYAMGNFLPQYFIPGTGGGAIIGLFIHDLVGLFVTPLGWGLMYYFVPIILRRPMWSHALSLVGFWGLAFFYPLTGIHHFLYTPIPMFLQYGAVVSTIAVEFVVLTVIINFLGTVWDRPWVAWQNLPLRWFFTGIINYGVTCAQCALQTTLTFQQLIHFSDWVVGHAHLVMLGVFGFWLLGIMIYLIPRLVRRDWYSKRLNEWHYGLTVAGMTLMFFDLLFAGIAQGVSWGSLQIWEDSLAISLPFWWVRVLAGLMIIAGQICFFVNVYLTLRTGTAQTEELVAHA
ncbi:MAG: cbb3-type cytochrome c oxidase subunit I [Gemmatales bacterium]|nr:cbb3-type cytochrome c oxidase subunit I [Gemmatales bacterium]MDW8387567.1 cbb3-type cytochrome c oxidase subunit I [Gemmatales bacterium]